MALPLLVAAVFGEETASDATRIEEDPITADDRDHWAFRPLVRPPLPSVEPNDWVITPIDRFIFAELRGRDLFPMPAAGRVVLIRRVTFDLTGLPPTPAEVDGFLVDRKPGAYARLVDRLLAAPAYGERWAQHWLDLARFAETDGFEHDKVRSRAWRYRDWVIASLNGDVPYDRFVSLQLAGDEIAPGDASAAVATAFCLAGPDMPDINSQVERRQNVLNELTGTVSSVLLGLQMGCAQCHEHKYDPISQGDFYRLQAFFAPAVNVKRNQSLGALSETPGKAPASHLMIRGDWRRPGAEVHPRFPRVANIQGQEVPADRKDGKTTGRRAALARWLTRPDHPLTSRVMANRLWQYHFGTGLCRTPSDFGVMGDEPYYGKLLDWLATELVRGGWSLKRMHRLIVTSAVYRQASRPSGSINGNVAEQNVRDTWQGAVKADPDNQLWARANRRRLVGEAIRDAMLAAAGRLSTRGGGPGVMPPLPPELVKTLLGGQWKVSPDREDHHRRSIYVFARRNLRYPIFDAFDRPDGNASCAVRSRSTTAPQSLLLLNSELSLDAARHLAGIALGAAGEDVAARIRVCFRRTLSRQPTDVELKSARSFLQQQSGRLKKEGRPREQLALPLPLSPQADPHQAAALTDLCLAMFNLSEFLYVD